MNRTTYMRNKRIAAKRRKRADRFLFSIICVLIGIYLVVSANAGSEPVGLNSAFAPLVNVIL